jgi:hypothetical protein
MRIVVLLIVLGVIVSPTATWAADKLQPTNTYAVIVGVLTWEEKSLTKYSAERRQDVVLHQQLRALGVPAENMTLLLDEQATRAAIESAVESIARKADHESTLIVYYAGHGMTQQGEGVFACYDIRTRRMLETGWRHKRLAKAIQSHFRGDTVLLLADCCFSGTLQNVAKTLNQNGYRAASLTSAGINNASSGNWTYTLSLVDSLSGHPVADTNADGWITLGETAAEVKEAMRYFEKQRSGFSALQIDSDFQLAKTRRDAILANTAKQPQIMGYQFGQFVSARIGKHWKTSRVLACRATVAGEKELLIQSQTYNDRPTTWLAPQRVRRLDERTTSKLPPIALAEDAARSKASLDGKLSQLLAKIEVAEDWKTYGAFHDFGNWSGNSYANQKNLPKGHWVYVFPHWYIWQTNDEQAVANADPVANARIADAIAQAVIRQNVPNWDAKQMIGKPDTPNPGDQITAWAPGRIDDGKVWAEVDFTDAIQPKEIHIYENCSPGAVYQLTGFDGHKETLLWKGVDPTPINAPMGTSKIAVDTKAKFQRIRIYLNCALSPGWNEIDAVALIDQQDKEHWAVAARANCTYSQNNVIKFVDPFQTEEDRKADKWAIVKAKLQAHKQRVRQYEAAINEENRAIKKLLEELDEE